MFGYILKKKKKYARRGRRVAVNYQTFSSDYEERDARLRAQRRIQISSEAFNGGRFIEIARLP